MLPRAVFRVLAVLVPALPTASISLAQEKDSVEPPNVLLIVADDLGWGDVGYHGSPIKTPHLDRLAKEGVVLDQHYVQPMCTPTRVALLTGRYPSRFGDQATKPCNERVLPWGTETLASALADVGYDTGLSGKWHLGSKPEWRPNLFGFAHSYGSLAGGVGQYNHLYKKGPYSRTWHRNGQLIDEPGHSTELIAREVLRWIEAGRRPWFYYVPFTAVHVPVEVPERFLAMYEGETFDADPVKDDSFKRYAAYTTQMDDAVGRLLKAVDKTGQRQHTVVIFLSDNGSIPSWRPSGKYPGEYLPCPRLGSNLPLRGRKAQMYEGGIRVPALISWPGKLRPRTVTEPMHAVDWMPTLTRLCGYRPQQELNWDGRDIWPLLTGEQTNPEPRALYWKFIGRQAVRLGEWKAVFRSNSAELYHLADDPHEKTDLAKKHPEKVDELRKVMQREAAKDSRNRPADPASDGNTPS